MELELSVSPEESGSRLDAFLARRLGLSRGYVRRLLGMGRIRIEGAPAAKGALLRAGEVVLVAPFRHPSEGPVPSQTPPLQILKEEAGLVAVDKPAGVATHPLDFEEQGTLLNALVARYPEMVGVGEGGLRSGLVHRLDIGTSGALVFARRREEWERARRAFAERRVEKRYVARVHGDFRESGEVILHLAPRGRRMRVLGCGGREAVTRLRPLEPGGRTTLVEARPVTGLMHQIRVTVAHLGHPVVGDVLYGSTAHLDRHLLHSAAIEIEGFRAESPVPLEILEP